MRSLRARLERLERGTAAQTDDPGERGARLYLAALTGQELLEDEQDELAAFLTGIRQQLDEDYGPRDEHGNYTSDPCTKAVELPLLEAEPAPPNEV